MSKTWGDAELDRLWREMREIEMGMDDMDLVDPDSPKLKQWEAVNSQFKQRLGKFGEFAAFDAPFRRDARFPPRDAD